MSQRIKQLTIDFDTYENELNEARMIGEQEALELVAEFIKSPMSFNAWWTEKHGEDITPPHYWMKVIRALIERKMK